MGAWEDVLADFATSCVELGSDRDGHGLFFRGHLSERWSLQPSLARLRGGGPVECLLDSNGRELSIHQHIENNLYYQLLARAGHLLPRSPRPWEILFLMRHHGFPTRLLDWSRSFGVALFFAITRNEVQDAGIANDGAAVWILNPGRLNIATRNDKQELICYLDTDYPLGYEQYFAHHLGGSYGTFPHAVVAALADAGNERIRMQKGAFTLHRDLDAPLESAFPSCVRKVVIPRIAFGDADSFLTLAGIDLTSLFPDLDTLAGFLAQEWL